MSEHIPLLPFTPFCPGSPAGPLFPGGPFLPANPGSPREPFTPAMTQGHHHSTIVLIMWLVGGVQDTTAVPGSPWNPFIPRSPLVPLSPIHPLGPLIPSSPGPPGGPGSPLGRTTPAIMNTITQCMHSGKQCTAMAYQLESLHMTIT